MKIKVLLLAFVCVTVVSLSAQEYQPQVGFSTENGSKVNFKKNKAGDNVFISLGGGASALFGDYNGDASIGDRLSWAASIAIGKWYTPYIGWRMKFDGGPVKNYYYTFTGTRTLTDWNEAYGSNPYYGNLHADILWDITNYWAPYNEKKVVRFIPFAGIGYSVRSGIGSYLFKRTESPSVNLGINIPFRLGERVDLFLEGQYTLLNEAFNRIDIGHEEDRIFQGLIGLNFKLGRTNFEVIEPMDYDLLNDLNSQINALRAQNDELSKRPKSCPECPKVAPVVEESRESLKNVVFFRLNSSVIDKNQEGNIYNTSEYAKKYNLPVKVVGYADKKTGNADYNYGLSERRARAVAKRLTEKYGIPTEKISIEWKGDTQQPYGEGEHYQWNRLVIMDTND
ncbi:MAG: OmpA family protein [Tannerella sp.]|jgi:outer membrane protein OmpA-like peptidoglycan-associated protein|nr:OmpA family protein [Tannerella sp.]